MRAHNINTIDEVPDSSWFTNRILARPLSIDEAVARPARPATARRRDRGRSSRRSRPGSRPASRCATRRDDRGSCRSTRAAIPEAATGAIVVANKIFWALGYWQVENHLVTVRPGSAGHRRVAPVTAAVRRTPADASRAISTTCCGARTAAPDGSYRAIAARAVPGKPLGGFRYHGTRPDDPNDVVPHEHRRELRALKVFGAWTNLVDMKAGNTLDASSPRTAASVVRHYLQDVGSTFGTGANGPREYDEGWEFLYEGA